MRTATGEGTAERISLKTSPDSCLSVAQHAHGGGAELAVAPCSGAEAWRVAGTVATADGKYCIDSLNGGQHVGLYECHGGDTQKWAFDPADGVLRNTASGATSCVNFRGTVVQTKCRAGSKDMEWDYTDRTLRPRINRGMCIERSANDLKLDACIGELKSQEWVWAETLTSPA